MQLTNEKNGKKILTQKIYKIFLLIIYIFSCENTIVLMAIF